MLKEHEIHMMEESKTKKEREIQFYENTLKDMHQSVKEEQVKVRNAEENNSELREQLKMAEIEQERVNQDRQTLNERFEEQMYKI